MGRPAAGRTWMRSPATSVRLGTSMMRAPLDSRLHAARRISRAEFTAPPTKSTMSGSHSRARTSVRAVEPSTGTRRGHGHVVGRRHDGPDDVVAQPALATQHPGHLVDLRWSTAEDYALEQAATLVEPVDEPAQQVAAEKQERHPDDEREEEQAS